MKTPSMLGAVLLLAAVSSAAAEPIRAGYEVELSRGEELWRASTVAPLGEGQPIRQGLGPYVVTLGVTEGAQDRYTLSVRVTGLPGTPSADEVVLDRAFEGDHREQLEFAASDGTLAVKGVIFVGAPRLAAK